MWDRVQQSLRLMATRGRAVSVDVEFTAPYAIFVHEDLEAHHAVGNAKFLERPAREMSDELAAAVTKSMQGGSTMEEALEAAGNMLMVEAKRQCPVATGFLRDSATVRVE